MLGIIWFIWFWIVEILVEILLFYGIEIISVLNIIAGTFNYGEKFIWNWVGGIRKNF